MTLPTKQLAYTAAEIDILLGKVSDGINTRKKKGVLVYANTSNVITFTNPSGVAYPFITDTIFNIHVEIYDSEGNPIFGYTIFDETVNGFKITVSDDGFLDYTAIEVSVGLPT